MASLLRLPHPLVSMLPTVIPMAMEAVTARRTQRVETLSAAELTRSPVGSTVTQQQAQWVTKSPSTVAKVVNI